MQPRSGNFISNLGDATHMTKRPRLSEFVRQCRVNRTLRRSEHILFYFISFLRAALTCYQSNFHGRWRFKDGVFVDDELGTVDLENVRAACSQQSRSQWTAIASRDRLYQFMAMSDGETQAEMRRGVSTNDGNEELGFSSRTGGPSSAFVPMDECPRPRGTKR